MWDVKNIVNKNELKAYLVIYNFRNNYNGLETTKLIVKEGRGFTTPNN